jgi:hypothetical protein
MRITFCRFVLLALIFAPGAAARQAQVWIGISFVAEKEIAPVDGKKPEAGFRITALPYGSPARKAGMRVGDIIVAMEGTEVRGDVPQLESAFREVISRRTAGDEITFRVIRDAVTTLVDGIVAPENFLRNFEAALLQQPPGATARLSGVHERKFMDIKVPVEIRPAGLGSGKEYSPADAERRGFPSITHPEEQLAAGLLEEFQAAKEYDDLRQRLARLSRTGDPFRLARVAYIQHNPFQLRTVAGQTFDRLGSAVGERDLSAMLRLASDWLDAPLGPSLPPLKTGLTLDQHIEQLIDVLAQVQAKRDEAFARLTSDDRKFLAENSESLFAALASLILLDQDSDQARLDRHARILDLSTRVDYNRLFEGAALLWRTAQDSYLDDLELAARKAWDAAGRPAGIFVDRESVAGKIQIGGTGITWYSQDAALVLDLGGNDFYTNNSGSPRADKIPVAMMVDFSGDDSYEATFNWSQGAALMSHGLLIDRKGNDHYVGQQWSQGAAVFGSALLLDESGNDVYRGNQYTQGVAAWGIAIHMDSFGEDIYEAHFLSQGVATPGGAGWLLNAGGNDRYYSKGTRPTSYGDAGIFDSWSQGCAIGFRGLLSGGIALLYDTAGKDRYEAGNFSQGGGYYFGIGMLRDGGNGDDAFIGSRYNQGFAAHQSIGYLEDEGGDDFYTTRHAVAQSIAWDEAITAFIDRAGNDVYEGGASFSQGSSAHNGFSLFLDLGGRNRFVYDTAQGSAGPNDYHGGASFSLFVAAASRSNTFTSKMTPSSVRLNGDRGFFAALPNSLESAVRSKSWRPLLKKDVQ